MSKKSRNNWLAFGVVTLLFVLLTGFILSFRVIPKKLGFISLVREGSAGVSFIPVDSFEDYDQRAIIEIAPGSTESLRFELGNYSWGEIAMDFSLSAVSTDVSPLEPIDNNPNRDHEKMDGFISWAKNPYEGETIRLQANGFNLLEFPITVPADQPEGWYTGAVVYRMADQMSEEDPVLNDFGVAVKAVAEQVKLVYVHVTNEPVMTGLQTWEEKQLNLNNQFRLHMGILAVDLLLYVTLIYFIFSKKDNN